MIQRSRLYNISFKRISELLKKPDSRVLVENFTSLSILQILNYLLPLITLPYLTRVIGLDMFGVLAMASAIIIYFDALVDFGFDFSATRDIANCQGNIKEVSRIYWTVTFTKILLFLISLSLLLIFFISFPYFRNHYVIILLSFLYLPGRILFPEWFFQGMEKMKYITFLNILSKVLFTILIFFIIKRKEDYIYQPVLLAAGYYVSAIASVYIIYKHFGVRFYLPSASEISNAISRSFNIFINMLLPTLYNNLSTLLLGLWWGSSSAGIFDAAKKVIMLSDQALMVLSRTFYPYLAKNISKHKFYVKISFASGFTMAAFFFIFSGKIVNILFAPEFHGANMLIRIMAISPIINSLMNAFGTNYLILVHKERILLYITLFSSVVGLLAALFLVYNFKQTGAAFTLILARSLIACLCIYYAKKIQNSFANYKQYESN